MFNILVVDDDKNTRRLFKAVLEADGYNVLTADNGETALDVMDNNHIDLVVLDIMMPHMDGYEFTETLRSVQNSLPILMVSAKQLPEDKNPYPQTAYYAHKEDCDTVEELKDLVCTYFSEEVFKNSFMSEFEPKYEGTPPYLIEVDGIIYNNLNTA